MILTQKPSKIVGVRVGELEANLLNPDRPKMTVRYVLLRDPEKTDGVHAGQYSKDREFGQRVVDAFHEFIKVLEEEVLVELFDTKDTRLPLPEPEVNLEDGKKVPAEEDSLQFPTLGGEKGTPQF